MLLKDLVAVMKGMVQIQVWTSDGHAHQGYMGDVSFVPACLMDYHVCEVFGTGWSFSVVRVSL